MIVFCVVGDKCDVCLTARLYVDKPRRFVWRRLTWVWQGLTGILQEQANCILTPTAAYKFVSFTKTNALFQINKRKAAGLFNSLHPVVTICTTSLTFNNSTFCPHSVFMWFVWIWEQTAIISLYSVNWLVFI